MISLIAHLARRVAQRQAVARGADLELRLVGVPGHGGVFAAGVHQRALARPQHLAGEGEHPGRVVRLAHRPAAQVDRARAAVRDLEPVVVVPAGVGKGRGILAHHLVDRQLVPGVGRFGGLRVPARKGQVLRRKAARQQEKHRNKQRHLFLHIANLFR